MTRYTCTSVGTISGWILVTGCLAAVPVVAEAFQPPRAVSTGTASGTPAAKPATGFRCSFIGDTLVPRLAMGVRRIDGDEIDVLELRREPGFSAPVTAEKPLFRLFFVVASRSDSDGKPWHLLQDGYVAEKPLGWAPERHLHLMDSRYAYTFAARQRERLADLHDNSKESYDRLLAQLKGDDEGGAATVVKERKGAEHWNPVTIDDTVPFVEIRIPSEERDREHPDTTPTFRFGIPVENRLVHMGAVCGGPRNDERLRRLKEAVVMDGMEMLFVVDETISMQPYNQVVADFITAAGRLAVGRPVPVRIVVCSYADGPEGKRVTIGELQPVKGPDDVRDLAERVSQLGNFLPPGQFSNPPERMLEGLRDALAKVKFQRGATVFVAVVGDTGHEPEDAGKPGLVKEVAKLIADTSARVYFMHVGRRKTPDDMLFEADSKAVRKEAEKVGVPGGHVVYQPAERSDLKDALEKARSEVEAERRRLRWMIARIESRSPFTEPGPKLLKVLESRGGNRERFDDDQLQYFVPSRGWLFHPTSQEQAEAEPQLRELFFLAPPEREAVKRLLDEVRVRLGRGESIDSDAIVGKFAADLAEASGAPPVAGLVEAAWERMPQKSRSVGTFLEDVFGLRLKAALPFPPTAYAKDLKASQEEIERMQQRTSLLGDAFKAGGDAAVWFDASSLMP